MILATIFPSSAVKLFADDTSIFFLVHDTELSSNQLNDDLKVVSDWAYQWKMSFNPYLSKQAQEMIFSKKAIGLMILQLLSIIPLLHELLARNI